MIKNRSSGCWIESKPFKISQAEQIVEVEVEAGREAEVRNLTNVRSRSHERVPFLLRGALPPQWLRRRKAGAFSACCQEFHCEMRSPRHRPEAAPPSHPTKLQLFLLILFLFTKQQRLINLQNTFTQKKHQLSFHNTSINTAIMARQFFVGGNFKMYESKEKHTSDRHD